MTTGVDAQTCKLIVLDQTIQSMTEFKQIIGRGTRIREDFGKLYFTIIDFKKATELFADPDFDGDPVRIYEPKGDESPVAPDPRTSEDITAAESPALPLDGDPSRPRQRKAASRRTMPSRRQARTSIVVDDVPVYRRRRARPVLRQATASSSPRSSATTPARPSARSSPRSMLS